MSTTQSLVQTRERLRDHGCVISSVVGRHKLVKHGYGVSLAKILRPLQADQTS